MSSACSSNAVHVSSCVNVAYLMPDGAVLVKAVRPNHSPSPLSGNYVSMLLRLGSEYVDIKYAFLSERKGLRKKSKQLIPSASTSFTEELASGTKGKVCPEKVFRSKTPSNLNLCTLDKGPIV
jgi:hypothetical protein